MSMPVCPVCHKVISASKMRRHKTRCGKKPTRKKAITQDNVAAAL